MTTKRIDIFTIGHGSMSADEFVDLLKRRGIEIVADARSIPYSRHAAFCNYGSLEPMLVKFGIDSRYMGVTLGGKPADPAMLDDSGAPDYVKMARSEPFLAGIEELASLAREKRACILCSEENPARCHRGALIAPELERRGFRVCHIRKSGDVETNTTESEDAPQNSPPPPGGQLELF